MGKKTGAPVVAFALLFQLYFLRGDLQAEREATPSLFAELKGQTLALHLSKASLRAAPRLRRERC